MRKQSKGNNYTSKINVFPVLHTILLLGGQKWIFLPHRGEKMHFITLFMNVNSHHENLKYKKLKILMNFNQLKYKDL